MADDKRDTPRPFDVKTVEYLLRLMTDHDLSEVDLTEGDHRIRLRKPSAVPVAYTPVHAPVANAAPAAGPVAASPPPAAAGPKLHEVKSELIGTFYAKPKPDKDDYVKAGGRVGPDTTICQIEAMKIFNEIKADCAGTVREVCVKNGQPVEFGTVLFRVELS